MDLLQASHDIYLPTKEGIRAYGVLWELGLEPVDIEAHLYESAELRDSVPGAHARYTHFSRLVQHLQPVEKFAWHRWTWECAELYCDNDWWTCWGPSASGKSCVFGVFALCDWCIAPFDTATIMVSTTLEMIKDRAYKFTSQHWNHLPERFKRRTPEQHNGTMLQTVFRQANPVGLLVQEVETANLTGAGIKCIGFKPGESIESIKGQIGRHLKRMRLYCDELQGTNPAVLKLPLNMFASGDGQFGGWGNPDGWMGPLGIASAPEGGETAKGPLDKTLRELARDGQPYKTKKFKTKKGECLFLDGFEAPSIKEPKKYHYLIQPKHIADQIKNEGADSPWIDTYIRGIIPRGGSASVVLSAEEASAHNVGEQKVVWAYTEPTDWIALDLSHSGTDEKIMRRIRVGKAMDGRTMLKFMERVKIIIDGSSTNISRQIAVQVIEKMTQWNVPIIRVGGDATATQGAALDMIEELSGQIGIQRISFSGSASEKPVKEGWPIKCKDRYKNKASEMAGLLREFCLCNQVAGFDDILTLQASQRRWIVPEATKDEVASSLLQIDPEKRVDGKSPDDLDAAIIGVTMIRDVAGIYPKPAEAAKIVVAEGDDWQNFSKLDRRGGTGRINDVLMGRQGSFLPGVFQRR